MNSKLIASVAFATALVAGAAVPLGGAQASPYSENFESGFQGTQLDLSLDPVGNVSDRYAATNYYTINNANGWTFSGSAYFALGSVPGGGTNGAVLLNETTGAGTTMVGLSPSTQYLLSFTYWGDNRPGQAWVLNVNVNGSTIDTINGVDGAPGSNPSGTTVTIPITSDILGNITLLFWQGSQTQASPIFDDVQISQTPLPAALPLFAGGLGVMGLLGWRKKRKAAVLAAA